MSEDGFVVVPRVFSSKGKEPATRAIRIAAATPPTPPTSGSDTPPFTQAGGGGDGGDGSGPGPAAKVVLVSTPPPSPGPAVAAPGIHEIKRIGAYAVGKKLGEGAFAVVRKGMHMQTKVPVSCLAPPVHQY